MQKQNWFKYFLGAPGIKRFALSDPALTDLNENYFKFNVLAQAFPDQKDPQDLQAWKLIGDYRLIFTADFLGPPGGPGQPGGNWSVIIG